MRSDYPTSAKWALATVMSGGAPLGCVETEKGLFPLDVIAGVTSSKVADLFDEWDLNSAAISAAVDGLGAEKAVSEDGRLAPVMYPGKVLCAGANYFKHIKEMGADDVTKESQRLFFFFKPAKNAVVGEGETVHMPLDTEAFDWEVELAIVIGKRARAVSVEDALDYVAGYTVAVDFCARDLNRAPDTFYKLDWVAGKAQETCCPLGPRFIPAGAMGDPQSIGLRLSVNDEVKQDDTTGDMIFTVAEQIATASRIMTLDPGDVLLTGTPAGVGQAKQTFLSVGDKVTATIDGIGSISNTVMAPKLD